MKTIKFTSNYGNFATSLTAEIGEDVNPETVWLAETQGLGNLQYRVCGSAVDKALGVKVAKDAKFQKRSEVAYSAALAEDIMNAVSAKITEMEGDAKVGAFVKALKLDFAVTGEYVPSEGAGPSKEAKDAWAAIAADPARLANAVKTLELAPGYSEETAVRALQARLLAAKRAAAQAALAKIGM